MKNMLALSVSSLALLLSFAAHADKATENPACATIAKACESAGFMPGDHKKTGKGLWVDCVGAIAKGKSVTGVTATADEAKACQASHKSMRKSKKS